MSSQRYENFFSRSSRPEVFCNCKFIKKESLAQVFSYEFCEFSKSTLLHRTPLLAASVFHTKIYDKQVLKKFLSKLTRKQNICTTKVTFKQITKSIDSKKNTFLKKLYLKHST